MPGGIPSCGSARIGKDLREVVSGRRLLPPHTLGARAVSVVQVVGDHLGRLAVADHATAVDPDRAVAELGDRGQRVGNEHHRPPRVSELLHASETAPLELGVANRKHLVDEHDLGLEMRRHGEGEADVHPARVALDRRVDEPLDAGELDDLVEAPLDLAALHPEDRTVQVDVLASCQLLVEARPDLEQAADPAADLGAPGRRRGDPGEDLQQRRLPGAVAADDAQHLALRYLEGDVLERPDLGCRTVVLAARKASRRMHHGLAQRAVRRLVLAEAVLLGEGVDLDRDRTSDRVREGRLRRAERGKSDEEQHAGDGDADGDLAHVRRARIEHGPAPARRSPRSSG